MKRTHRTAWGWRVRVHRAQGDGLLPHTVRQKLRTTPARDRGGQLATDSVRDHAGLGAGSPGPPPERRRGRGTATWTGQALTPPAPPLGVQGRTASPSSGQREIHTPLGSSATPEPDHLSTFCALRPPGSALSPGLGIRGLKERNAAHFNSPATGAFQKYQRTENSQQLDASREPRCQNIPSGPRGCGSSSLLARVTSSSAPQ